MKYSVLEEIQNKHATSTHAAHESGDRVSKAEVSTPQVSCSDANLPSLGTFPGWLVSPCCSPLWRCKGLSVCSLRGRTLPATRSTRRGASLLSPLRLRTKWTRSSGSWCQLSGAVPIRKSSHVWEGRHNIQNKSMAKPLLLEGNSAVCKGKSHTCLML